MKRRTRTRETKRKRSRRALSPPPEPITPVTLVITLTMTFPIGVLRTAVLRARGLGGGKRTARNAPAEAQGSDKGRGGLGNGSSHLRKLGVCGWCVRHHQLEGKGQEERQEMRVRVVRKEWAGLCDCLMEWNPTPLVNFYGPEI
mmetsp:Transcript_42522/g.83830  ORF Transcript_42522/g.83830 Transcript_42522/m.83830 type:complete len:144 (+) Transcript_42522:875-1306(+)